MVEMVVLGSGTPVPSADRAGSALAVVDGASWMLVDCGRAATQRALATGLDLRELEAVLITHHHSDHLSDLATLASTRWTAGAVDPLLVVAPAGPSADFATGCLDGFADEAFHGQAAASSPRRPSVSVRPFAAAGQLATVLDGDGWRVSSVLVDHHPVAPAVGYRIERGGVAVAVSGDTAVCDGVRQLAAGAGVLVHEALLTAAVRPSLLEWNAGTRSVGELAARTRPGCLVLTHLIPAPESAADEQRFLDEVRDGGFTGPTLVARDLLRVAVSPSSRERRAATRRRRPAPRRRAVNSDECFEHALAAYERAMFEGDREAIADGLDELDFVDAAAALARGRLLHARFIDGRQPDATEGRLFERAVELFVRIADRRGEAEATFWLATYHQVVRGDHDSALPLLQRAESLAREAGDSLTRSYALRHLAFVEQAGGRLDAARAMLEESTALRREVGHSAAVAANLVGLAHLAAAQQRHDECPALLDEATELATGAEAWRVLGWIDDARARLT